MVNPVITAQAIATLNELAPGRVVLGMGAGDKTTLEAVGIDMGKPLAAVRESIEMFRKLTAGEKVAFQGEVFRLLLVCGTFLSILLLRLMVCPYLCRRLQEWFCLLRPFQEQLFPALTRLVLQLLVLL